MSKDTNFDKHSQRFKKNIYDTDKGRLRLKLVSDDLFTNTPVLNDGSNLNILDAGCGMGQVSLLLAKQGHQLTLCDISADMLDIAEGNFNEAGLSARFINSSIQELNQQHDQQYDLVVFHAVLEWLEQPKDVIASLKSRVKPGGYISLMFYNRNSIIFYNILKGNFRKIVKQDFKGHPGGLTPINPIDPAELDQWLDQAQIKVISKTGIRVFYDYLNKELKTTRSFEDILQMEQSYASAPTFNMMGRYIHYICRLE